MPILRKIHAWAGLALCLVILPLALSGAALVFKPQWLKATAPHAAERVVIDAAEAARTMSAAQAEFPGLRSVIFAGPDLGVHEALLKDGGAAYLLPRTQQPLARWSKNERAVDWLFDLHHHLLTGEAGTKVSGVAGLLAAAMVITGLTLWFPTRRSFSGAIRPMRPGRAGWLAAHRDLGLISAPVLLALLLTGAAVALSDVSAAVMRFDRPVPPKAGAGQVDWAVALAAAQVRFPEAELRIAAPPAKAGAPAQIRLRQRGEWHANGRTVVYVDPADQTVIGVYDAMRQEASARLFNAFWPIHASKVGGLAWKLITFLGGLSLAALSIYGAESYRRRLFPRSARPAVSAAPAE